jgi:hypothetical protein
MELAYLVITVFSAAFTGRIFQTPYIDGDLFWQKHLGEFVVTHHALPTALGNETFTAPGAPWTAQEWLLGVISYAAISHGVFWLLAIAAGLALALTLLLASWRAHRFGGSARAVALASVFLAIAVESSFGIRAQVFAWPLFAALLLVLDQSGPIVLVALAIVAAWANVHGSVMLAIPIVWIDAIVASIRNGIRAADTRWRLLLALLVPFATLASPLGVRLPQYAVMLINSPIRASIKEWQPISFHGSYFFWEGGAPMLLVAILCLRTLLRERPRDVAWAAMLTFMAIGAVRNVALMGIVVAPLAARAIDVLMGRFGWWHTPELSKGHKRLAVAGAILLAGLTFYAVIRIPPRADAFVPPVTTFDRLGAMPEQRRVFCYDFSVCSLALDHRNLRVFMDGRADPYPPDVWYDFNVIRRTEKGWSQELDLYRIDTVVAKNGDRLDRELTKRRDWSRWPQLDPCCRVYVRPPV